MANQNKRLGFGRSASLVVLCLCGLGFDEPAHGSDEPWSALWRSNESSRKWPRKS